MPEHLTWHKRQRYATWLSGAALLMIAIAWLSSVRLTETWEDAEARALTPCEQQFTSAAGFEDAYDTVICNCSMCHAREPVWGNMRWALKGVYLETPGNFARHASQIYPQAGLSHAMPPPNAIEMDAMARQTIIAWVREVRASQ